MTLPFWFILSVTLIIYLMIYPGMQLIQNLLQVPQKLTEMTKEYISVVFSGIIFVFLYNFFTYLLRAMGNSFMPLVFLAVSSVLNIALDIWFVVGLELGVSGAAWATVIAQAVSGIGIAAYSMAKLPLLRWDKDSRAWDLCRLKEIIVNDVATGIQQSVMNFGILMIQGLVNSFGAGVMASFAAAVKIDTIAYMPAQEFGNAYSLFVSQNYGAKKSERIRSGTRTAFAASAAFCALISVLIFAFAGDLMRLFIDADEAQIIAGGNKMFEDRGSNVCGDRHTVPLVRLFPRNKQTSYIACSHGNFHWYPRRLILRPGTAYRVRRGRHMVLHTDRMVPGGRCGICFLSEA